MRPLQRYQHVFDVTEVHFSEPVDVVGSAFGLGNVLVELTTISPFFGYAAFAKGAVGKRHQVAQSEQRDRLHPARPGRIIVFGRPLFVEPD